VYKKSKVQKTNQNKKKKDKKNKENNSTAKNQKDIDRERMKIERKEIIETDK
jgi:hypothetical protein